MQESSEINPFLFGAAEGLQVDGEDALPSRASFADVFCEGFSSIDSDEYCLNAEFRFPD